MTKISYSGYRFPPSKAVPHKGHDSINPPNDSGDETDGSKEVSGEPVITGRDATKVFEAAEGIFDAVPLFVGPPVEAEGLLPVRLVGNDGLSAAFLRPLA